jgi:hypothetical protein
MLLSKKLYDWDKKTKIFSSKEDGLVLDFTGIDGVTFNTGSYCTFKTGHECTFNTGPSCTFKTSSDCTFKTGYSCAFYTGYYCTFNTGNSCTFDTGSDCTFKTDSSCTFLTGSHCTFKTGNSCTFITGSDCAFETGPYCTFNTEYDCTFNTGSDCIFKTGHKCTFIVRDNCFVTRLDIKGVTEIPTGKKIQLNGYEISGYTVIGEKKEIPTCNGKVVESDCTFNTSVACTFKTSSDCTFGVGDNCYLIRYDVKGVTEIPANKKIKLNGHEIAGYTVIKEKKETPTCNGKVVEIDGKKYKLTEIKE